MMMAQLQGGFLPTRGTFMLDFVFIAMFLIVLILGISIFLVRKKRLFRLHKRIQLLTAVILLAAIVAFEIDVRFFTQWEELAEPSRYYEQGWVHWALAVHLLFAIPTPFVWVFTIFKALKNFPADPQPNQYSPQHKFWGWTSTVCMVLTAATGWFFYLMAFVM
ncbi:MAG: DUF420 domain-containing protein [Pirellulaceae bacterium]|nr:DUF420 domain-containing protein [Pirellulaceae bacterium]MDG2103161.1 DUF420 domain-containing protein [Pirellulaceae bacterium]